MVEKKKMGQNDILKYVNGLFSSESSNEDELYEGLILGNLTEENVEQVIPLLEASERLLNLAGLRMLTDSNSVGISKVYGAVDKLFERNDLILNRMCLDVIQQHDSTSPKAMRRMMQFINTTDVFITRTTRTWLMCRSESELTALENYCEPLSEQTDDLISLLIKAKAGELVKVEFWKNLKDVDEVAFDEYQRMSKSKIGKIENLFKVITP